MQLTEICCNQCIFSTRKYQVVVIVRSAEDSKVCRRDWERLATAQLWRAAQVTSHRIAEIHAVTSHGKYTIVTSHRIAEIHVALREIAHDSKSASVRSSVSSSTSSSISSSVTGSQTPHVTIRLLPTPTFAISSLISPTTGRRRPAWPDPTRHDPTYFYF